MWSLPWRTAPASLLGALALAASGCGGRPAPTAAAPSPRAAPPLPGAEVKAFAPLTIKPEAKAPARAVVLGTDATGGSTVVPLPAAEGKATVDALFVRTGGGAPAEGAMAPVRLTARPAADQAVQVGFFEDTSGGTGSQWRAGVWVSAFVAANVLGKDLTDFQFSAASGGNIDGASASGLMAGGFLAAITGQPIDPTATMTGIINPDGTIGPVGGIPEKFRAALARGKKRLGYPVGLRFARSEATGEPVDLAALAQAGGGVAVELATVHDAYRLLTGKGLPEAVPVTEQDMALDDETARRLDAAYQRWQGQVAEEWAALLQLDQAGRLPASLAGVAKAAQRTAAEAEKLRQQGFLAPAYARILAAWVYAASANSTYEIYAKAAAGDEEGAIEALVGMSALDQATREVFQKIGALRPSTLGGHLQMMSAFQTALRGWGAMVFAAQSAEQTRAFLAGLGGAPAEQLGTPEAATRIVDATLPTVLLIARTVAQTAMASQSLDFQVEQSVDYTCSVAGVRRLATSFQAAAAAGVTYFETLLVEPAAKEGGVSLEQGRIKVATSVPEYLVALVTSRLATSEGLPKELRAAWGETSLPWNLLSLAASELAYHNAAELIAKYYSLSVTRDGDGHTTGVEHDKAFITMLANAERSARQSARAARIATGAIPVQARLAYQLAAYEREGSVDDKLDALAEFWVATAYAQAAVMLARN